MSTHSRRSGEPEDDATMEDSVNSDVREDTIGIEGDEEAEAAARNEEELQKKRTAMDSLSIIEKHFSSFTDRQVNDLKASRKLLYDERIAQLGNELALLTQPNPTHPEYLAMLKCVDARRDEKIQLEQIRLDYELRNLQKRSVGDRAQILSQFYQDVRDIREKKLDQIGEQWYKIHHDRKRCDGPDYSFLLPNKRSEQIRRQAAYNLEVSILSGVAKYHGFPAAPELSKATAADMEDDFRSMGLHTQLPKQPLSLNQPRPPIHAAPIARFVPAAQEIFLETTPWANPQHPVHFQTAHRQAAPVHVSATPYPSATGQRSIGNIGMSTFNGHSLNSLAPTPISDSTQQNFDRLGIVEPMA
ncbi:MAG: hypothetical protein M1829_002400 [Trizodia sp. TS-e1964]|nr:MAG: hypothetical protein M1829_002400 [Trizodia sp. TS-e1964]